MENIQLLHTINSQIWSLPTNNSWKLWKSSLQTIPLLPSHKGRYLQKTKHFFLLSRSLPLSLTVSHFFTNHTVPKYFNCLKFTSLSILHSPSPVMKFEKCIPLWSLKNVPVALHALFAEKFINVFHFPFWLWKMFFISPQIDRIITESIGKLICGVVLWMKKGGETSIPEKPISIE